LKQLKGHLNGSKAQKAAKTTKTNAGVKALKTEQAAVTPDSEGSASESD
jgi:hypothetical protein